MRSFALLALVAAVGCATSSVQEVPSAYPDVATVPEQPPAPQLDLETPQPVVVPALGACDAAPPADPRCPVDVLTAAAMSYLDKTVAEFDGTSMRLIEYDRDALLSEALADDGFRRLVQLADAAPTDGILDHAETRELESAVLRLCDARVASRRL
jgi:hypothetical protein